MADVSWSPTHHVPHDGLQSWRADGTSASALDGGLEVMVVERSGDWARVRCSNGWETWVDARGLVASDPGDVRPRKRRALVLMGVAVVALGALAGALVATRGSDDSRSAGTGGAGVKLNVPGGWALSDDGLVAAARSEDLAATVPGGPRVRAVPSRSTAPESVDLLAEDDARSGQPLTEAKRFDLAGRPVADITLRETEGSIVLVRRYLAGTSPLGVPILFILEAPEPQFPQHAAAMLAVPGWTYDER